MKKNIIAALTFLMLFCFVQSGSASTIRLFDYAFNADGAIYKTPTPFPSGMFNFTAFDTVTGLGTITTTISGQGSHYFSAFFDLEIDVGDNTFYNEFGSENGTPETGQTWEIDEPGYVFGNIYNHFVAGTLDNTIGIPAGSVVEDVSMAMAWDFILDQDETATIHWIIGTTLPSGFYLSQTDPDTQPDDNIIYFSSALDVRKNGIPAVPEPATMVLFGFGLLGLTRYGRRREIDIYSKS